jgi:hypothetical protein
MRLACVQALADKLSVPTQHGGKVPGFDSQRGISTGRVVKAGKKMTYTDSQTRRILSDALDEYPELREAVAHELAARMGRG